MPSTAMRLRALRVRRVSLGLTLKEVAALVGVGITRINSFEQGIAPPLRRRKKYAEALKMSESTLDSIINGTCKIKVTFE